MRTIFRSEIVNNAGKLISANVIAQAVGILVYPLLTRLYAPEDFALLSLFTSISGVLALIATAEYQYAIMLPKSDVHARAIAQLCGILLVSMVLLTVLSLPFASPIAGLFKAPELARWWWLMPLNVLGLGLWNILNYWYIRRKEFRRVSEYQVSQCLFSAGGKLGFGFLGWLRGGLVLASVAAPLVSVAVIGILSWHKHLGELLRFKREELRTVAREYANFPKFNLPRSLVNAVNLALPVWLLTPAFGMTEVGRLSLAMLAAFVPLNIIARACYQVLFQRVAASVQDKQPIRSLLLKFSIGTFAILAVGLTAVYIFMPQLVTFFFGADWIETAAVIRKLYPYIALMPVCGAVCFLSDVFAKQKIAMYMEIGYMALMLVALWAGIHSGSFLMSVSAYAWAGFAYQAVQLGWFASLVHRYSRS